MVIAYCLWSNALLLHWSKVPHRCEECSPKPSYSFQSYSRYFAFSTYSVCMYLYCLSFLSPSCLSLCPHPPFHTTLPSFPLPTWYSAWSWRKALTQFGATLLWSQRKASKIQKKHSCWELKCAGKGEVVMHTHTDSHMYTHCNLLNGSHILMFPLSSHSVPTLKG